METAEEHKRVQGGQKEKACQKTESEKELIRQISAEDFRKDYEQACLLLQKRVQEINERMSRQLKRDYVSSVEWRVKSPESCVTKLKRKGRELTLENAVDRLNDIAGVRVVCSFLDDMYQICHQFAYDYEYELIKEKDYIKSPKNSGYQSLHLILRVPLDNGKSVRAEMQFRTQAMDFWAGVEHHFVYKKEGETGKKLEKELKQCARAIYRIDRKMMRIRNRMEA